MYGVVSDASGVTDVSIEAITRSASGTWGPRTQLAQGLEVDGAVTPLVAQFPTGEIIVSWIESTTNLKTIMAVSSSDQSVWTPPVTVATGELRTYDIALSATGEATFVWARGSGGGTFVEGRVRSGAGTLGLVSTLGVGVDPRLEVTPNGNVTAIWLGENYPFNTLRAATRTDGGSWGTSIQLSGGGSESVNDLLQTAVTDGNEVTVMWEERVTIPGASRQLLARTRAADGIWGALQTVTQNHGFASSSKLIATPNRELTAFWEQGGAVAFPTSTRSTAGAWGATTTIAVPESNGFVFGLDSIPVGGTDDLVAVWAWIPDRVFGAIAPDEIRASLRIGGVWERPITLSNSSCSNLPSSGVRPAQVASTSTGKIVATWACETATGMSNVHSRTLTTLQPLSGVGSAASQGVLAGLAVSTPNLESFDATSGGLVQTRAAGPPFARPTDSASGQVAVSLSISGGSLGGVPMAGQVDFARSAIGPSSAFPGTALTFIPFARDALTFGVSVVSDMPRDIALGNANQDARPVPLFTLRNIYRGVVTSFIDSGANTVTIRPVLPPVGSETRQWWLDALGLTEQQLGSTVVTAVSGEFDGGSVVAPGDIVPFSVSQYIAQGNHASLPAPMVESRAQLVLGQVDTVQVMVRDANGALHANPDATISRPLFAVVETARLSGTSAQDAALQAMFEGPTSTLCSSGPLVQQYGLAPIGTSCGNTNLYTQALRVE